MRILLTGGGTGGHIYPIIAVVEELKALSAERKIKLDLLYLGSAGAYANLLKENGIAVSNIISAKLRRYLDARNFIDFALFPLSIIQALWKVFWYMPDVLFSKGGPGALPVILACRFYRIPVIIHESDSVPGLTTRLSIPFAERVAVAFSSAVEAIVAGKKEKDSEVLQKKIAVVGNPVRSLFFKALPPKEEALKPVLLVIGGSQGAVRINDFMISIAGQLVGDFQILHQTGLANFDNAKKELNIVLKNFSEEEKNRYKIFPYFENDLIGAYVSADLIISRAGSGSIFEIAAVGKPAILVPLASAAGNHQVVNAYEYANTGAAIVVEESNLKLNIFIEQLRKIFSDQNSLRSMAESAKKFAKPDSARIIASEIIELVG